MPSKPGRYRRPGLGRHSRVADSDYDAVKERLNIEADRPDGMIIHTAGFTADGVFRIFDVWSVSCD
jgi:hypothetical protein